MKQQHNTQKKRRHLLGCLRLLIFRLYSPASVVKGEPHQQLLTTFLGKMIDLYSVLCYHFADVIGLKNILYSWTYYDFNEKEQPEPAAALEQAKKGLHNGCVYMFHSVSDTNTKILGDLIDYIRAEGFEIRSLDE